ncbi:MAG: 6-carboxytetrahydropterin synthase [Deltaproteobacteria bacterium]
MADGSFEVFVGKEYLKFNAAHFIAYPGFRERLHGHNYHVAVRVEGDLGPDGYVIDFGLLKKVTRAICDEIDEHTILPKLSDCLVYETDEVNTVAIYEDGARFSLPRDDVMFLPIVHSSAEELARFFAGEIATRLGAAGARPWKWLEVSVSEAPNQMATYRQSGA